MPRSLTAQLDSIDDVNERNAGPVGLVIKAEFQPLFRLLADNRRKVQKLWVLANESLDRGWQDSVFVSVSGIAYRLTEKVDHPVSLPLDYRPRPFLRVRNGRMEMLTGQPKSIRRKCHKRKRWTD